MLDETSDHSIQGPVVVLGVIDIPDDTDAGCEDQHLDEIELGYRDVVVADLRVVLSFFLQESYCYGIDDPTNLSLTNPWIIFEQPEWCKGVQINNTHIDQD
jgi:hypothetical protein